MKQITDILRASKDKIIEDIERLRKNQLVLMSPQRQKEKLVKIYEILPEGIEEIDKTETNGFNNINFGESKSDVEIYTIIDEVVKEIQDSQIEQFKKNSITKKLSKLKDKLEI